jgi:hypothetical protein
MSASVSAVIAGGEDLARLAVRGQVAGEDLPVVLDAHLRREAEDVVGAADLVEGVGLGDAELEGDEVGNLLLPRGERLGGAEEDLLALVAGERRGVGGGDGEGLAGVLGAAGGHGADHAVGVGVAHLDDAVGVDLAAGDPHRLVAHLDRFGLGHHACSSTGCAAAMAA